MRPKTVASSDLARLLWHQRTSHWPRLSVPSPSASSRGGFGHRTDVAYAATLADSPPASRRRGRIRCASSELLARTSLNHDGDECWADARGPAEECGKAGSLRGGWRWMRGGTSRPNAVRHGRSRKRGTPDWISAERAGLALERDRRGEDVFDELGNAGLDADRFRLASNHNLPGRRETTPLSSVAGSGRQAES